MNDYTIDAFVSWTSYTLFLTTIVLNMLIAVMTDRYEIAISEMKFHDAKKRIGRSLRYDLMKGKIYGIFFGKMPQTYHYLFVSIPLSNEQDPDDESEGMIGKIMSFVKSRHEKADEKMG